MLELVDVFDKLEIIPFKGVDDFKYLNELLDELSNKWLNLSEEEKINFSVELLMEK